MALEDNLRRRPGRRGGFTTEISNVVLVLTQHPFCRDAFAFNEFIGDIVTVKTLKWPREWQSADTAVPASNVWAEADTTRLRTWMNGCFPGLDVGPSVMGEALHMIAQKKRIHPVRDWLMALPKPPKKRKKALLDDWLVRIAGAEDTPYVRAVGERFLIGAVARAYSPGAKVDSMPVFQAPQGRGKSTLVRILAGEEWFLETAIELGSKDSYQVLRGKWIVEFGELGALHRGDLAKVKQFLTARVDTYRPSYGRKAIDFYRQCVFAGTIDVGQYLKDEAGARRFWPITLGHINIKQLQVERDELWAEAKERYLAGRPWYFDTPELVDAAAQEAEERRQGDPWEAPVASWLREVEEKRSKYAARGVTTYDVLTMALKLEAGRLTRGDEMRAAAVLKVLGWGNIYRPGASESRRYRRDDQAMKVET